MQASPACPFLLSILHIPHVRGQPAIGIQYITPTPIDCDTNMHANCFVLRCSVLSRRKLHPMPTCMWMATRGFRRRATSGKLSCVMCTPWKHSTAAMNRLQVDKTRGRVICQACPHPVGQAWAACMSGHPNSDLQRACSRPCCSDAAARCAAGPAACPACCPAHCAQNPRPPPSWAGTGGIRQTPARCSHHPRPYQPFTSPQLLLVVQSDWLTRCPFTMAPSLIPPATSC